jgi:AAHS family benzoate transporter-like MFS transporter
MSTSSLGAKTPPSKFKVSSKSALVIAVVIGWLLVVSDGYDLIVYGTVQSSLIKEWGLTEATAGTLGSAAFLGMMIGALYAGRISDRLGRRRTLLWCTALFSIFTVLCGLAPSPILFGVFRFIAGLGLGGLIPATNALTGELVSPRWRAAMATVMMSGVPVGGVIAALAGAPLIVTYGWRVMFFIPLLSLLLIPIAAKVLPETMGKSAVAAATPVSYDPAASGTPGIFRKPHRTSTAFFGIATFATLFTWFGLGTWLPRLMELQGFNLGSALMFTLALNVGAVVGSVITGWAGGRFGPLVSGCGAALAAGLGLIMMTQGTSSTALMYFLLVFAGIGTHGTLCLIIAAVSNTYEQQIRGTALGWALGIGRVGAVLAPQAGGLILGAKLGVSAVYYTFAFSSLLSAGLLLALALVNRRKSTEAARAVGK